MSVAIVLNRSSSCTHLYNTLPFLLFLISFTRFFRIPVSPGNGGRRTLDNFSFLFSGNLAMAIPNYEIHGKFLEKRILKVCPPWLAEKKNLISRTSKILTMHHFENESFFLKNKHRNEKQDVSGHHLSEKCDSVN